MQVSPIVCSKYHGVQIDRYPLRSSIMIPYRHCRKKEKAHWRMEIFGIGNKDPDTHERLQKEQIWAPSTNKMVASLHKISISCMRNAPKQGINAKGWDIYSCFMCQWLWNAYAKVQNKQPSLRPRAWSIHWVCPLAVVCVWDLEMEEAQWGRW